MTNTLRRNCMDKETKRGEISIVTQTWINFHLREAERLERELSHENRPDERRQLQEQIAANRREVVKLEAACTSSLPTLESSLQSYLHAMYPNGIPRSQHSEVVRGFYAGAWATFDILEAVAGPGINEDLAGAWMEQQQAACKDFADRMFKTWLEQQ